MNEERKVAIRAQLQITRLKRQYPRRSQAKFSAENDHNPLVLNACLRCHGTGQASSHPTPETYCIDTCPDCNGAGTTYQIERYFLNEFDLIEVRPNPFGWIECPYCHIRFQANDSGAWTGLRHKVCGQKINILNS